MKKILLAFAFLFSFSVLSYSQGTTPRGALAKPNGSLVKTQLYCTYDTATDLSGKDTTYYAPGGRLGNSENAVVHNYLHIKSAGDTLYSSHCITIKDTTVNGVPLAATDNYSYLGDRLTVTFKTKAEAGVADTLFWYGSIVADTIGSGSNNTTIVKKDATKSMHVIDFVFNGTHWIPVSPTTVRFNSNRP